MKSFVSTIIILSFVFSCSTKKNSTQSPGVVSEITDNWPTESWEYDTINKASLFKPIIDSFPGKHSIMVINYGKIIYEHYQEPYSKDSLIHVNSCTKTVISMLFGALFKEDWALIEDERAIDFFRDNSIMDSLILNIKLKHFLSMSSGLEWKGGIDAADVVQMSETDDWVKYVFDRKVVEPPGVNFRYNSGGTQVIAAILDNQTEKGLMLFAKESLFHPLGIMDFKWDSTPRGVPKAGWGLHIKIKDMAKLGYLLLQQGKWDNQQIVSNEWVSQISRKHIVANDSYDYGYQVWIPKNVGTDCFLFIGSYPPSKKIIAVLPELNSVVAYVGENYNTNDLLRNIIVPGLKKLNANRLDSK